MAKKKNLPKSLIPVEDNVKKLLELAYNLQATDRQVTLRALDNIPDFVDETKAAISAIQQSCDLICQSNQENMRAFNDNCKIYLSACRDILNGETLSQDQKLEVLARMEKVLQRMDEKDTENKQWNLNVFLKSVGIIGTIVVSGIALVAAGLGSSRPQSDEEPKELDHHYDYES